ncbi:MAG: type II toxin-antitoxin system RelE/ParE family toxin [Pyrinomonadaceae bacterium]
MTIVITESASDDIAKAYLFYEHQFAGLGDYFESSIFSDIRSLAIYAGVHELHFEHYYRKVASKFPYAIYYTIDGETVRVHAVAGTRRDPVGVEDRFEQG